MKLTGYLTSAALILSTSFIANAQWSLTGNASTNPATNFLGTTDVQPVIFKTNGTEGFRLTETGLLGVGTTTPGYKLTVKVNLASGGTNAVDGIRLSCDGTVTAELLATKSTYSWAGVGGNEIWLLSTNGDLNVGPATTAYNLKFMTGQAERMRISSTGNVGVGNTNPAGKLDVSGLVIVVNASGNNYNENLRLPAATSGFSSIALGAVAGTSGTGVGQWTIMKYPAASSNTFAIRHNSSDMFTIMTNGNAGFGTTTPSTKLHVYGTPATGGADGLKVISNNASSAYADLVVTGPSYSWMGVGGNQVWLHTANGDQNIGTSTAHNVKFIANGAERMRITTTGNVGLVYLLQ
jgi:hypothetical protein